MGRALSITAFDLAQRFVGIREVSGKVSNPLILAMLTLDQSWPQDDAVPWCSAFVNYVAWLLRLPRSKDLRARSWLRVGAAISIEEAEPAFDVVILQRGGPNQPGPGVIDAPGHVGLFAGREKETVLLLGGNQSDTVNVSPYPVTKVLGVRRLM